MLTLMRLAWRTGRRSRDVLVGGAVAGGLVQELLGRLEWRTTQQAAAAEERDEAVERVLAVDVLRLLAAEGPHAPEVRRLPLLGFDVKISGLSAPLTVSRAWGSGLRAYILGASPNAASIWGPSFSQGLDLGSATRRRRGGLRPRGCAAHRREDEGCRV